MFAVTWAQKFARVNRDIMMSSVLKAAHSCSSIPQFEVDPFSKAVNCHHNYVNLEMHFGKEVFLTRKGAVSNKILKFGVLQKYSKSPFFVGSVNVHKKFLLAKQTNKKTKPKAGQKMKEPMLGIFCLHLFSFLGYACVFLLVLWFLLIQIFKYHDYVNYSMISDMSFSCFFRPFEPGYLHFLLLHGLVHLTQGLALLKKNIYYSGTSI